MANQVLQSIVNLWTEQAELAEKAKERDFGKTAKRAWDFLGKNYSQLYLQKSDTTDEPQPPMGGGPYYKARRNLSREYVSLMLPFIHAKVPSRRAEARRPQVPHYLAETVGSVVNPAVIQEEQLRAFLLTMWLNYLPDETGLSGEIRRALPEALVKGRCLLWHELSESSTGLVPGSFFGSVDDLLVDPDSEDLRDAAWVMRKRRRSAWRLAEESGVSVEQLRGVAQSNYQKALSGEVSADEREKLDVVEYYEVFSRMGVGAHLKGAGDLLESNKSALDNISPYVYLVIVPGLPFPLNLPPEVLDSTDRAQEVQARLEWPIPFHQCPHPWPFSELDFYPNARNPWAASPLEGVLPLLVFLDHLYSYIMSRIRVTCRDLIITSTELGKAINDAIKSGKDQEIVQYDGDVSDLARLLHIIDFNPVNVDYWKVVEAMERAFERGSGMDPLLYGSHGGKQMRSAREADIREGHVTSRPNDFADLVEGWNSAIAAKEAMASRLYVQPPYHLFGEPPPVITGEQSNYAQSPLSLAWASLVSTDDPAEAASYLRYTVEAGSGRRKNRQARIADAQGISQMLMAPLMQYASSTGNTNPFNALLDMLAETYEMPLGRLKLPPMQIQPQGVEPQEGAAPQE